MLKKLLTNLTWYSWMCNSTIILAVYSPHILHILVNISWWNLKYILSCVIALNTITFHICQIAHTSWVSSHIPPYYKHHHVQLCGHNIYHHSQNMNQYILQQIPLLYDVLHKIMARISSTLLSDTNTNHAQQHLLYR